MLVPQWLKHTNDQDLQQATHEKISQLQAVEKDIPGVIIIHNLAADAIVYLSERGRKILNVSLEEVQLSHSDYHRLFFNPEDIPNYAPKVLAMVQRNADDDIVTYFQQVRAIGEKDWKWYASSTKILLRDKRNKPLLAITVALPIDAGHHLTPKIERLIEENIFLRENQQVFSSLSKREKEVLGLMSLGHNSLEVAERLFISEATAKTHRRNIRNKLNATSYYDLLKFAQAFNLV